ncbi:hypothetical protein [Bacteroides nordii]|uniref:hypothetical protein n=1 Tax=Bacteroides nordii TaxID=291645 RepID=UPI00241D57AB|nr:hypothetical protein [Bacteroides nordii]MBD9108955.1 hypothetical protein [Bacteroides nordii]
MLDYKRGHRAECNLIIDPVDKCNLNSAEIGSTFKKYVSAEEYYRLHDNHLYMTMPIQKDSKYIRVAEICAGCKLYCADEDELYEIDKKLNELGYETRVGRNMYTGNLSIAVIKNPKVKGE